MKGLDGFEFAAAPDVEMESLFRELMSSLAPAGVFADVSSGDGLYPGEAILVVVVCIPSVVFKNVDNVENGDNVEFWDDQLLESWRVGELESWRVGELERRVSGNREMSGMFLVYFPRRTMDGMVVERGSKLGKLS